MDTNHNRIKMADLEKNLPNKFLTTNSKGELEFSDISTIQVEGYNALDYVAPGKVLDARQGKILKNLIDDVNLLVASDNIGLNTIQKIADAIETGRIQLNKVLLLVASDNVNLNTLQKIADAIEAGQAYLNTLLVNDLSTGGTAKALTAEMGKVIQNNKVDKIAGKSLLSDTEIARLAAVSNYTHPANHPPEIISQNSNNRFVTDTEKANWNSKADLLSPSFTGVPTAPTAASGSRTTQLATNAFVANAVLALSNDTISIYGNQKKTGVLSFDNGASQGLSQGIRTNSGANTLSVGAIFDAAGGTAVSSTIAYGATGYKIDTEGTNGILINLKAPYINQTGIKVNATPESTAILYRGQNNGVDTYTVNKTGDIIANTFTGGATLTGVPTAPTAAPGTNTTQIATTAFVQSFTRPYKVYTALLSQSGTNPPVATVLENTLGGLPVWSRAGLGSYSCTLTGTFASNKTVVFVTRTGNVNTLSASQNTADSVSLSCYNPGGSSAEMNLNLVSFEIRVYN
ncbi:hypothetical protein [Flavobacterium collinsii]|uniref:Tail fiber protein n=1 Tax=Flavobacterium collinsii TaxID=1114861 RepID=A0A9W4X5E7_9FLAO|nr:hypothetical protein [Flavobacterium collinsii]GIQ57174.1 hypothetical protein Flavo103_03100 [Flavobacterium collinsii]CAI2769160.1 conserved protein of unknown function [Flavobacterium collinsii]